MKKLIIHIGTGKTGSTSLQHFLRDNNKELNSHNYNYASNFLIDCNHHNLSHNFLKIFDKTELYEKNIDIFSDYLHESNHHEIISSEFFTGENSENLLFLKKKLDRVVTRLIAKVKRT